MTLVGVGLVPRDQIRFRHLCIVRLQVVAQEEVTIGGAASAAV